MLITKQYKREQQRLHKDNDRYGRASIKHAPDVARLIALEQPETILDYGAGKGNLGLTLGMQVLEGRVLTEYDPGIKGIDVLPENKFDMVCCIDVLEHIEPECLDDVLRSLYEKTGKVAYITVHTGPAGKILSDGRNAHLIQKKIGWWVRQLGVYFTIVDISLLPPSYWLICRPRKDIE